KEAEATLRRAADLDPTALAPRIALASYYWSGGDVASAERELRAGRDISPDSQQVNRALAMLYLATNRRDEAREVIETWAGRQKTPQADLVLADFYVANAEAARARQIYERIPDRTLGPVVATRLAQLDLAEDKRAQAYERLEAARTSWPRDERLLATLAGLLLQDGRDEEARARVDELLTAHPSSARGWLYRARLLARGHNEDEAIAAYRQAIRLGPTFIEARLELSAMYLTRREPDAAVEFAREAIAAQPTNPRTRLALARAYTARGNYSDARLELDRILQASPGWVPALVERGILEAAQGRHAEARRIFTPLTAGPQPPIDAVAGLVRSQLADRLYRDAEAVVARELARLPDDPTRLMLAASVAQAAGDRARTERTLRRVIEVAPERLSAYNLLGQLLMAEGRLVDARREFEALAKRQPRPVGPETMIAMTYEFENRPEDARRHYERALSLDPRAAVASNNLAWLLAKNDEQLGRALELATVAARELPDQAEVIDTLGWVHYRQGAARLAVSHFERAVALGPETPVLRYHLALALEATGDRARARREVEAALASNRPFAERGEADALRRRLSGQN
ncbi:MAG: tetratricopeptide repeat protein, partial [Vicinamibacteraceae bacterium]|nr:tetratricopeptide repeat protein [Vicinamibacteraceae bacterium]